MFLGRIIIFVPLNISCHPEEQETMQIDTHNPEFQDALNLIQYTRQSVFRPGKLVRVNLPS